MVQQSGAGLPVGGGFPHSIVRHRGVAAVAGHAVAVVAQQRSVKFGQPFGAVLEVAQDGVPVGRPQRNGVEISVDAGLDDVGRCDSVGVPVSAKAGDDPPGVVRRDRCSDAPAVVCGRVPAAPRQT